jgi:hypothetical protein
VVQRQANQLEAQARQLEQRARQRIVETVPSKQHFLNWLPIPAPLLDLVERPNTRPDAISSPRSECVLHVCPVAISNEALGDEPWLRSVRVLVDVYFSLRRVAAVEAGGGAHALP